LQTVSDQELERAVEADMRQRRFAGPPTVEQRRPKSQETEVGMIRA
jgi:hypothetical protein